MLNGYPPEYAVSESSLLEVQIYLIRKINAITAEILGIICSRINVLKLIFTDNESKSKVDINNITNAE